MIEFRGVTKRFPDGTVAVDNLDLVVEAGGITVFVGPSGCGKTTSLRMINRMIEPTGGTILVDGRDIAATDAAELRRGIGYVIQQAGLFPHRTILDNIATVPLLLGWSKAKARSRAAELMEIVGLASEMAGRYPAQLSGGQQQRVGVARALAAKPALLLMDEPFGALDPVIRGKAQEDLLAIQRRLGATIVLVTHDMNEAFHLGDRIAVMDQARLLQYAAPADLLTHPAAPFVEQLTGTAERPFRLLSLIRVQEAVEPGGAEGDALSLTTTLHDALARLIGLGKQALPVIDASGNAVGRISVEGILARGRLPA
jgi:osmoprotectant transport system ATP-binding protein